MKRMFVALSLVLVGLIAYLLLWPVPIEPVAFVPSNDPGINGDYAPNELLAGVEHITSGVGVGPEDVTSDPEGLFYTGLEDGRIVRFRSDGSRAETFVSTEGRPLGMQFDAQGDLIVADGVRGLLSVSPDGTITVLADRHNGKRFLFVDDLDIAGDGIIWFSDASQRFSGDDYVLDAWETRPSGRLLSYDPQTQKTSVHMEDLMFANGVALAPGGQYVLVNETFGARIWRYWLVGTRAGTADVFLDLPGYPDNLSCNGRGIYWIALYSPRDAAMEGMWTTKPFVRKFLFRLPRAILPVKMPPPHGWVIGVDAEGEVVLNLQDPSGGYHSITSVNEFDGALYLGSNRMSSVGRFDLSS